MKTLPTSVLAVVLVAIGCSSHGTSIDDDAGAASQADAAGDAKIASSTADAGIARLDALRVLTADCSDEAQYTCALEVVHTFDDDGAPVTVRTHVDCEDTPSDCTELTYDGKRRITSTRTDAACDGETLHCERWSYDAAGRITRRSSDAGCDDSPELALAVKYDDDGRPVEITRSNDGKDACVTQTFDDDGTASRLEIDDACDDSPESCRQRTFDDDGHLIAEVVDDECDGSPQECRGWTYDGSGRLTTESRDPKCDGKQVARAAWAYDAQGNIERAVTLVDVDGDPTSQSSADDCVARTYSYDRSGNAIVEAIGPCTGEPDSCTAFAYAGPDSVRQHLNRPPDPSADDLLTTRP